ncbi:MAG: hypothetical protein J6A92_01300 [Lachnospiraceae bacterium]|nr:hypothetical protein [Lachnospiraceae bacterium]
MDYILIFDVIITILGAYVMFSAFQMKRKGEISSFIVNPAEITRCKDKNGFIGHVYSQTLIFGAVCLIYGLLALVNDTGVMFLGKFFNVAGVVVFLGIWIWYNAQVKKGKDKFFY